MIEKEHLLTYKVNPLFHDAAILQRCSAAYMKRKHPKSGSGARGVRTPHSRLGDAPSFNCTPLNVFGGGFSFEKESTATSPFVLDTNNTWSNKIMCVHNGTQLPSVPLRVVLALRSLAAAASALGAPLLRMGGHRRRGPYEKDDTREQKKQPLGQLAVAESRGQKERASFPYSQLGKHKDWRHLSGEAKRRSTIGATGQVRKLRKASWLRGPLGKCKGGSQLTMKPPFHGSGTTRDFFWSLSEDVSVFGKGRKKRWLKPSLWDWSRVILKWN